ncbi:MAG: hypothetical protein EXS05_16530 [Planctomycetaceae bacterium]|nr:hypothetical protein [Planctomycetaceae bacterium]
MLRCVASAASSALVAMLCLGGASAPAADEPAAARAKVYGEWRIFIKPDKGPEYDRLIETQGLPLFREAGGRMVGWWKILIGNLYEHVTIWEYDDMAAFEKAVGFLGGEKRFAFFVAKRDPLLAGEENRFLRLSAEAITPTLHDPAKWVIHEVHRVPLKLRGMYLDYLETEGLKLLEESGFRPVGPFLTSVGKWSETTLLFRFESLAERERLIARFNATEEGRRYNRRIAEFTEDVTTRLLLPAAFAKPPAGDKTGNAAAPNEQFKSPLLPHLERVSQRVFAVGFADKFRSANCGFVAGSDEAVLIDLPRGVAAAEMAREVERLTGKIPRRLALTHADADDLPTVKEWIAQGIREVIATPATRARLVGDDPAASKLPIRICDGETEIGDRSNTGRPESCLADLQ